MKEVPEIAQLLSKFTGIAVQFAALIFPKYMGISAKTSSKSTTLNRCTALQTKSS